MLGPGLARKELGVLRNVGSDGEDVAAASGAGAGVALEREAARAPPREPPRPRLGGILAVVFVVVGVDVSFGAGCCKGELLS